MYIKNRIGPKALPREIQLVILAFNDFVLASLAQKNMQSLLPKDTLLRTYLNSLQLVTGTVWRR